MTRNLPNSILSLGVGQIFVWTVHAIKEIKSKAGQFLCTNHQWSKIKDIASQVYGNYMVFHCNLVKQKSNRL